MPELHHTDTVVIGAGHAGLAVSRLLIAAAREHVVLDRGRVAERWRTASWDSLRLVTPTWMTRLPGWQATGDPDSFLSVSGFITQLEEYAASFGAPVVGGTAVQRLTTAPNGTYDVHTDSGTWRARSVVLATGPHGTPRIPAAVDLSGVRVITSNHYRRPESLEDGGVLVVGASASGVQIADELGRTGRDVVLAVGRHTRLPRRYRGMDIFWWLESTGRLARTIEQMPDPLSARQEPSPQLVGRGVGDGIDSEVDLSSLQRRGVRLVGRLRSLEGRVASLSQDLAATAAAADRATHRVLDSLDRYAASSGLDREVLPALRPSGVNVPATPSRLDLRAEGIGTVVLATGFQPEFSWVDLPIVAPDGTIRQRRGVTDAPGVYVIGQRFQHRRDSAFIDGARHDAAFIVGQLTSGSAGIACPSAHAGEDRP